MYVTPTYQKQQDQDDEQYEPGYDWEKYEVRCGQHFYLQQTHPHGSQDGFNAYSEGKWAQSVDRPAVPRCAMTPGLVEAPREPPKDAVGPAALVPEADEVATPGAKREAGRLSLIHI